MDDEVYVCVKHLKFYVCRNCLLDDTTEFYSRNPKDIERVAKHQETQ